MNWIKRKLKNWLEVPESSGPVAAQPSERREWKRPMEIRSDALVLARQPKEVPSAFVIHAPPPGVLPAGVASMANDASISALYGYAATNTAMQEGTQAFPYSYLAELAQRAEYRRPSETIGKEMTRKWIALRSKSKTDKTERIKALEAAMDRLNLRGVIRKAAEMDGMFGRSQIYIDLNYVDTQDREELRTPLPLNNVKVPRGSLKRFTVVEPIWTYPAEYNSTDPLNKSYYKPQSWYVMGVQVHHSRLLTIVGRPVADILKPAYQFGGLSMTQMSKPYVDNWLRTRQSVSDLVHSFSVNGLKTDMSTVLNGGAAKALNDRVTLFNAQRDNRGMMVIDKDDEEFFNVSTPLSTLDALQAQSQEQLSSVNGIPLSILLGITPAGLNASSEGEIRIFYQWIEAQQEAAFTAVVDRMLKLIQLSEFGEVDEDITFRWEPLWAMDEEQAANVRKTEAETDQLYIDAGVILPEEARKRIATEDESPYSGLDLSVEVPDPNAEELMPGAPGVEPGQQDNFDADAEMQALLAGEPPNDEEENAGAR